VLLPITPSSLSLAASLWADSALHEKTKEAWDRPQKRGSEEVGGVIIFVGLARVLSSRLSAPVINEPGVDTPNNIDSSGI
jgi:hypothetical protein